MFYALHGGYIWVQGKFEPLAGSLQPSSDVKPWPRSGDSSGHLQPAASSPELDEKVSGRSYEQNFALRAEAD